MLLILLVPVVVDGGQADGDYNDGQGEEQGSSNVMLFPGLTPLVPVALKTLVLLNLSVLNLLILQENSLSEVNPFRPSIGRLCL